MQCAGYSSIPTAIVWIFLSYAKWTWNIARRVFPEWQRWLVAVPAMLVLSGCAGNITSPDVNKVLASELTRQYIGLHEQYKALAQNLPESEMHHLEELARPMDRAKQMLVTYNDLVLAGSGEAQEAARVRERVQALIADLARQISEIALEQYYDHK